MQNFPNVEKVIELKYHKRLNKLLHTNTKLSPGLLPIYHE